MARSNPARIPRLTGSRPVLDLLHFAGALLGILVVTHLWIMVDRGFDRGCFGFSEPTAQVECEIVVTSDAGALLGVSNAMWGLLFYVALAGLGALAGLPATARAHWRRLRAVVVTAGFVYSAWLVVIQATQLGAFCRLCLISAGIVTFLFSLVLVEWASEPSETRTVMRKPALFIALSLLTVLLVAADISYFSGLDVVEVEEAEPSAAIDAAADPLPVDAAPVESDIPQAAAAARQVATCTYDESVPEVEDYTSLVSFSDPFLGSAGAPVAVYEFFDPNCPHCRTLHPVMKQIAETHGELARVYSIPFMLWPDRSLLPIEALYVAAQDGKFNEMLDALFAGATGQGYYTVPQLRRMAVEIGLDEATFMERLRRGLNREAIWNRRVQIAELGITSTPTVMINGRVVRTKTASCIAQLIEEAAG